MDYRRRRIALQDWAIDTAAWQKILDDASRSFRDKLILSVFLLVGGVYRC
jgi:hypothetical protein